MTPVQAFLKRNRKLAVDTLHERRRKYTPRFQLGDLFRTVDIKKVFRKCDSTNWSYKLITKIKVIHDTTLGIGSTIYPRDIIKSFQYK